MAVEFKLPALGENIDGGDVTRVLVKIGDTLRNDQPVLEIETGKATVEVPSDVAGVIKEIHVKEGAKAKVGQLILTVDGTGAAAPAAKKTPPSAARTAPGEKPVLTPARKVLEKAAPPQVMPATPVVSESQGGSVPAAPSTRQFAREVGVDIGQVAGSGPGGRISVDDVKLHSRANRGTAAPSGPRQVPLPDFSKWGAIERQPLNNIRVAAAEHLGNSWSTIPHVTLHDKVDITSLEKMRQDSKAKAGGKLTITPFLIKIAASALKVFPNFNSSIDLANKELVLKKFTHIGVAVDTERGLVVPVVRDADRKNVLQISAELGQLSEKARAKKLSPDEMQGSCFTITNLGGIGGGFFTPIVNLPEVAILGVGKAITEPVFVNGIFQPRLMMPLSLSFDHRVIDGADGARFLRWFIEAIQQPALISLEG